MNLHRLALLIVLAFGWLVGHAEPVSIRLVGDEAGFSAAVAARIDALIKRGEPETPVDNERPSRRLLIAVGARGWHSIETAPPDTAVLAVLPPRQAFESATFGGRTVSAVFADMPPSRIFNLVYLLNQRRSGPVALLAGPATQWRLSKLESAAAEHGLRLHVEKVERETDVGPAVERLVQHASLLLALPDPVAHTAATVPPLLLLSYRAGVPVVGYSEAYLRAGAVAALYVTPEQIAQQVIEIVTAYRQGKGLPAPQNLRYFTVGVNPPVARSLGMALPSAEELETRLRGMHE